MLELKPGRLVVEGTLDFDRLDDSGDVWAAVVWLAGVTEHGGLAVELRSMLGDAWWDQYAGEIPHTHGLPDKTWVGLHHPEVLRGMLGEQVRITVEVVGVNDAVTNRDRAMNRAHEILLEVEEHLPDEQVRLRVRDARVVLQNAGAGE